MYNWGGVSRVRLTIAKRGKIWPKSRKCGDGGPVTITRRGHKSAVIISAEEFERYQTARMDDEFAAIMAVHGNEPVSWRINDPTTYLSGRDNSVSRQASSALRPRRHVPIPARGSANVPGTQSNRI